ncbi:exodeoxyribonuclease VII small subunit [[Haemophilus] felis]|nr:exodeoxyribonuclease VII small subunit [[Haemophilus] felis]
MARKSTNNEQELDFESTLEQLEQIVSRLENGDLPLEEALKNFEQGIKLAHSGQIRLQNAEQRIQILLQKNDIAPLNDYQKEDSEI